MSAHPEWRKASASGDTEDCVEIAYLDGGDVLVRDSKDPGGSRLQFTASEWDAFLDGVENGEFPRRGPRG